MQFVVSRNNLFVAFSLFLFPLSHAVKKLTKVQSGQKKQKHKYNVFDDIFLLTTLYANHNVTIEAAEVRSESLN